MNQLIVPPTNAVASSLPGLSAFQVYIPEGKSTNKREEMAYLSNKVAFKLPVVGPAHLKSSALLLGGCPRVIVAIARCLHNHGIAAHVVGLVPELQPIRSKAIASFQYLPTDDQAFLEGIIDLTRDKLIEYIYPCGDEALALLMVCEAQLRPLVKIGCPSREVVQSVLDKSLTLKAARDIQLPVPKEYEFNSINDYDAASTSIAFPVIAKPRYKSIAEASFRLRHYETADSLREEFDQDSEFGARVVIQEFIPGGGVGIELLMHAGEPLVIFQHRRITELPIGGGVSVRSKSQLVDPVLADYALRLLRRINWDGVAMVEFRHDPGSGRLALMEVNGRYWGSLPLSFLAGLEFPWYEWQLAHGQLPSPPANYKLVTMRWLSGELQRAAQILGEVAKGHLYPWRALQEIAGVVLGFATPVKDAIWDFNDRAPALDELRDVWRATIKHQVVRFLGKLFPAVTVRHEAVRKFGSVSSARLFDDLKTGKISHIRPPEQLRISRLLVLCHGNIMRSPFIANVLSSTLKPRGVTVISAGLASIQGRPADPRAIEMARSLGVNLNAHRAQLVQRQMVEDADAVIVMDYRNLAMLLSRWPDIKSKVFLLGDFLDQDVLREISDPYEEDNQALKRCYATLMEACTKLRSRIVLT